MKKFAVIVPFIDKQIDNVVEQLHRWSLPQYAPCGTTSDMTTTNEVKSDLIFFYHKQLNTSLQEHLLSEMAPQVMMCFDRILFRYADLTPDEDVYPMAANYMFYRLVHDPLIHTRYEYMFYCEPDAWAIRDQWLSSLHDLSVSTTRVPLVNKNNNRNNQVQQQQQGAPLSFAEQFWVKGSIYRGPRRDLGRLSVNIHVNGNAIYHFTDEYLTFLKQVQASIPDDAFDVAQTRYLFRDPVSLRLYWHKFHFSEFIQNLWQVEWDERTVRMNSLETVFVHGKTKFIPKVALKQQQRQQQRQQQQQQQQQKEQSS